MLVVGSSSDQQQHRLRTLLTLQGGGWIHQVAQRQQLHLPCWLFWRRRHPRLCKSSSARTSVVVVHNSRYFICSTATVFTMRLKFKTIFLVFTVILVSFFCAKHTDNYAKVCVREYESMCLLPARCGLRAKQFILTSSDRRLSVCGRSLLWSIEKESHLTAFGL